MKFQAEDLTFLIPVRIDSITRLENVIYVVRYILKTCRCRILVLEALQFCNGFLKLLLPKSVKYVFIPDEDPVFYRTHYLNMMCNMAETPYIAIWDADVVVTGKQIIDALNVLRRGEADMAYPYDGNFIDVSDIIRRMFLKKGMSIKLLYDNIGKMKYPYSKGGMKGGGILVNREKYIAAGQENENFYGWGPEDFERYERWTHLGYKIFRSNGPMFHLTHPRDLNGAFNSAYQMERSNAEFFRIKNCSKEELLSELDLF